MDTDTLTTIALICSIVALTVQVLCLVAPLIA